MQEIIEGFRLSPQQRHLWLLQQSNPGLVYRAVCQALIEGSIDVDLLEKSIRDLVRQNEILRTRFHCLPGMIYPLQVLDQSVEWSMEWLDLSNAEDQPGKIKELIRELELEAVDLQSLPLRGLLIKLLPDRFLLIISLPALCADSASLRNLVEQISRAYTSNMAGESEAAQPLQYADLSEWQNDLLESEETETGREYWNNLDLFALDAFRLPFADLSQKAESPRIESISETINAEMTAMLQELASRHETTVSVLLLACWQVLLWRLGGQSDFVVGILYDGRNYEEIGQALGLFAKHLPVGCRLQDDLVFSEVLSQAHAKTLEAYEWQECFSWDIVTESGAGETRRKYIPICFEYAQESEAFQAAGATLRILSRDALTDLYELKLKCQATQAGVIASVQYANHEYTVRDTRRLLKQYLRLVESVLERGDRKIAEIDIVPEEERRLLLVEFNDTQLPYDDQACIHELIEQQAERTPNAIALSYEDQRVTYSEMNRRANQLAHHLRSVGVKPEQMVGICLDRSIEMVVGLLGIMKAGGAYVPIDPEYPSERIEYILQDTGARVVVTEREWEEKVRREGVRVVSVDGDKKEIEKESEKNASSGEMGSTLAYVIYTSGSTGQPKGALISHRNLAHSTFARVRYYAEPVKRYLLLSSFAFDSSVAGIFGTLCRGGALVLPKDNAQQDTLEIIRLINERKVSHILCLPSLYSILLSQAVPEELSSLQAVIVAGERCPEETVERHFKILPHTSLYNEYGPTEATVWSSVYKCEPGESRTQVPIGKPISNTQIYILNSSLMLNPMDVAGELYIGGEGLSRGYHNRADLTAERFIPNPFSRESGARLYKTGDLALYRADGNIEFMGRVDHQVKIRGYRIELGEIEAALERHPAVRESITLAREDKPDDKRIVAYVISNDGSEVSGKELQADLRGRLPEYMVPAAIVVMKEWPLTPNGKPDRNALPSPERTDGARDYTYARPSTPTEEMVAAIWSQVMGVEHIGVHDNFFDLGGHSLLATQINSRLRQYFKIDIPLRKLFETPTTAGLAESIERAVRAGRGLEEKEIERVPRDEAIPLSFAQQRLWFLDKLDPDSFFYNCPMAVRLTGPLNITALNQTLNEIVRRHEVLRTSFPASDGLAVQVISPYEAFHLPLIDLEELAPHQQAEEARRVSREEAQRPFDLERGPVSRVNILRVSDEDHIVLFTIHHIVSDDWSLGILIKEIAALYESFSEGKQSPLAELTIQYADYTVWQRDWLEGGVLDAQLSYWERQLASLPVLKLPTSRPRTAFQTYRVGFQSIIIPQPLCQAVKRLSQQEGVTLFMMLVAATQTLLCRYTGEDDVVVGTLIANRNRAETERLIGFFINTLVLRTDLSGNPGFVQLLARVREVALEAYGNQDLPFERLVEALQPERDLSHTPLFQTMFLLQNTQERELNIPGLTLSYPESEIRVGKFDLVISLNHTGSDLVGSMQYNAELFDDEAMARMAEHFRLLLESIIADPMQPISDLPMLTEHEQRLQLIEWNDKKSDYQIDNCIHHLFETQSSKSPDSVAVVFGADRLTYQQINARANKLAHYLLAEGIEPEMLVGICFERSIEMVVAMLGVLKAGAAYLPLDPAYPRRRLEFMLEDARASLVLTHSSTAGVIPQSAARIISIDEREEAISRCSAANATAEVCGDNLAYVIYTSGSTGKPKGVMISHKAISNRLLWMQTTYPIGEGDSLLQKTPISFDASVWEVFVPLMSGARLVIARPDGHKDAAYMIKAIAEHEITILQLVPSMLATFLEEPGLENCRSLKRMFCGGEALSAELQERFYELMEADLFILYGPTETSIDAASWACARERRDSFIILGNPISNIQLYLLSSHLQPVPLGAVGNLYIGGVGLARGYLNRPDLTAERFIPNPFSAMPGARLYKSGDLARYLPDGTLTFLGRSDDQIKVRGFRIEVGEIEAALARHPKIQQSVVLARDNVTGEKSLIAYVVPRNNAGEGEAEKQNGDDRSSRLGSESSLPAAELRGFLKDSLPEYMVPSSFVILNDMPVTPNGKLDRKALPPPEQVSIGRNGNHQRPRTPTEEVIAAIWSQVLGVDELSLHDDFFEMGGHSLKAIQINSRLRQAFQVEIPLRKFFEAPTIAQIAEEVETVVRAGRAPEDTGIAKMPRDQEVPLSFAQQRLWFLDQLEPGNTLYNLPIIVRIKGPLNVKVLNDCFNEIVRRHDVLRTSFGVYDGQPYQIVHSGLEVKLEVDDLIEKPENDKEYLAMQLALADARTGFDLSTGPLFRVKAMRLGEEEHILLLTMHHIISDGWSTAVLVREVAALYEAYSEGKPSPLAELPLQYADYAYWQRQRLQSAAIGEQISYWKQQLEGAEYVLEMPTDRARPAMQSYLGATEEFEVDERVSEGLRRVSRRESATMNMTLLAVYGVLLSRYSGQEEVMIGTPIAGRNRREVEGLIGMFVNTLAMRVRVGGRKRFEEVMRGVRETTLGGYENEEVPFERVVEEVKAERDLSRSPIFQVMFTLRNVPQGELEIPGLKLSSAAVDNGTARFDMSLDMVETKRGLAGSLNYSTDLFEANTIRRMIGHFKNLLEAIIANPQELVSSLPLLSDQERYQLLYEWNDTFTAYDKNISIDEVFQSQAALSPDAVAVVFEDHSLTYEQLNVRANQLAHHLRAMGAGPESLIGVCLHRSIEMVVGMLGILKSGGAYVPLEPTYPAHRLAFMIQDAGIAILLTEQSISAILRPSPARLVCLDADSETIAACSGDDPKVDVSGDNLAYMIYTSGSTGRPKGALIPHRGIYNRLMWMQQQYQLGGADRVMQKTPFSFDVSVWEFFWPLMTGARLVVARPEGHKDSRYLVEQIRQQGVSVLHFVPSMLGVMLEEEGLEECESVRLVVCSGEALGAEMVRRYHERMGGRMENLYGPTEASVDVTYWGCERGREDEEVAIGRPIANTQIYILDEEGEAVGVGVRGEIHIGGEGLGRGYHAEAGMTAERFMPDGYGKEVGGRLYKTGDKGRYREDGRIEYLGRKDNQVKVRGHRIELGEIEAAMKEEEGIKQCVVMVREEKGRERRIVGYVEWKEGGGRGIEEVRRGLKGKLPEYMMPSAFVVVEGWPVTANGKLDRKSLPAPEQARGEQGVAYVEPRTPTEELIAEIWSQVLGVERVGIHDNFFDLGGHSLLATQMVSRIREAFQVDLRVRSVFEGPTVAELVQVIISYEIKPGRTDKIAIALKKVKSLSDEELKRMIKEGKSTSKR